MPRSVAYLMQTAPQPIPGQLPSAFCHADGAKSTLLKFKWSFTMRKKMKSLECGELLLLAMYWHFNTIRTNSLSVEVLGRVYVQ